MISTVSIPAVPDRRRALEFGAAVVAAVATVATVIVAGPQPAFDASNETIATYLHDHHGGVIAVGWLGVLWQLALVVWFGGLWQLLGRAEPDRRLSIVAAIAFAASVMTALVTSSLSSVSAMRVDDFGTLLRPLLSWSIVLIGVTSACGAVYVGVSSWVLARAGVAPRWVIVVGAVTTVLWTIGSFSIVTDSVPVFVCNSAGLLSSFVWIIALTFTMRRLDDQLAFGGHD